MDDEVRAKVEADLEALLTDPDNPGFRWEWWPGNPGPVRWRSRIALLADGQVSFRYIVYQDHPYVGVVALLDLGPIDEDEEKDQPED